MANILDVSAYILEVCGRMTTMKLQKLTYYCQAHSLAIRGEALFANDFEAWANGPVCASLYGYHRGQFIISKLHAGDSRRLNLDDKRLVEQVCAALSFCSADELIERTHREEPWLRARKDVLPDERSNSVISKQSMLDYYCRFPVVV